MNLLKNAGTFLLASFTLAAGVSAYDNVRPVDKMVCIKDEHDIYKIVQLPSTNSKASVVRAYQTAAAEEKNGVMEAPAAVLVKSHGTYRYVEGYNTFKKTPEICSVGPHQGYDVLKLQVKYLPPELVKNIAEQAGFHPG